MILLLATTGLAETTMTWCSSARAGQDADVFHAQVAAAFADWEHLAGCVGQAAVDLGDCSTAADAMFLLGDPDDVTTIPTRESYTPYTFVLDDAVTWQTDADVEAGCTEAYSVETALRHGVGHAFGFPHADAPEAVMAASVPDRCEVRAITDYDYGAALDLTIPLVTPGTYVGAVPYEVCLESDALDNVEVRWVMGDGSLEEGSSVCHTYTSDIATHIELRWEVDDCVSGTLNTEIDVLACAAPHTYTTLDESLFRYTVHGNDVDIENIVDNRVDGCADDASWIVTDAAGETVTVSHSWSPTLTMPAAGTYTILARISGVGGTSEATQEVTIRSEAEEHGCAAAGGPIALGIGLMGFMRRR